LGRSIKALAIDPATSSALYAGTRGSGVQKGTNGGGSWSAVNSGLTANLVQAQAIDPGTPATVYAGTHEGGVVDMQEVMYRTYLPLVLRSQQDLGQAGQ
jgi:hypothetical protein